MINIKKKELDDASFTKEYRIKL